MSKHSVELNPYTNEPYSSNYYKILSKRQQLPVFPAKEKVQKLVKKYQVVLLVGETGSGKTTQIPQFLLELQPEKKIVCTQPRRVAAMTVSARVAEEMDVELGNEVGYTIRFEDVTSDRTMIKYATDGMLLREAMVDPLLSDYSVIILDEAHERTVSTDIILGLVQELITKRPELRVVVMSATMEEQKFQKYFSEAPLVHITGRMYNVEIYHCKSPESNYLEAAVRTVVQIHLFEGSGDILMFLTGEDEIEMAIERIYSSIQLAEHTTANCFKGPVWCVPLYSALPPEQQRKVFRPASEGTRKIVVATNIAETSVTIDGVVFVVDSGFSKQKVFNPKLRIESLLVTPISQAAANQRAGRAGRTQPGKCFRLYTAKAFETLLQPQTYPEILRCNLGTIVLNLKKVGIEDLVHFDFVDPPAPETLMHALEVLNYLGALDDNGNLTEFGERMSHFPVDPEMAAMLLNSEKFHCTEEIAKIAAILSVQNPFLTGGGGGHSQQQPSSGVAVMGAKKSRGSGAGRRGVNNPFYHQTGDHLMMLQVFEGFEESGFSTDWCREYHLNPRALKQAVSVYKQLTSIMRRLGIEIVSDATEDRRFANNIRRAILSGYFTHVAMALPSGREYSTLKDKVKTVPFPTTCLNNRKPTFVIYHETVLTSNNYLRTITAVSDDWLLEACERFFGIEEFEGLQLKCIQDLFARRESLLRQNGNRKRLRSTVEDVASDSE